MIFTAFGLARSGTTALSGTLNSHPHVFCAIEAIHPSISFKNLNFPDCLLDEELVGQRKAIKNKSLINHEHRCFGNKFPRYYKYLDDLERDDLVNIGIYRENFSFAYSWNERVRVGENWPKGRTGIIGIIEQIILLISLANCDSKANSYLFSYEKLLKADEDHFLKVFSILKLDGELARESFIKDVFNRNNVNQKERTYKDVEILSANYFDIESIDKIIYENSGSPISKMPQSFFDRIEGLTLKLPKFIAEIKDVLTEDEIEYLKGESKFFSEASKQKVKLCI